MYERPQIITLSSKKGGDEVDVCGDPIMFDNCDYTTYCVLDSYCVSLGVYKICHGSTFCQPAIMFNM